MKSQEILNKISKQIDHKTILAIGLGTLTISYIMVLIIDFWNILDSRTILEGLEVPLLWNFLFSERGPIELLQWTFLALFALTSAYAAGITAQKPEIELSNFWKLFSIAGILMLMEDSINIRNFFLRGQWPLEWQTLNILETFYFILLAAIPLYAIWTYRKEIMQYKTTFKLMIAGFFFYGLAAFISGPADLTNFNYYLSTFLYEGTIFLGGEELRTLYESIDASLAELREGEYMGVNYRLVDFLVEESLELLGVTMLLSSSKAYLQELK